MIGLLVQQYLIIPIMLIQATLIAMLEKITKYIMLQQPTRITLRNQIQVVVGNYFKIWKVENYLNMLISQKADGTIQEFSKFLNMHILEVNM